MAIITQRPQCLPRVLAACLVLFLAWLTGNAFSAESTAGRVRLSFAPTFDGRPLQADTLLERKGLPSISLSRADLLLSRLALRRSDGSWLESEDWFAHLSLQKNRWNADSDGVPSGSFTAIRFDVGLPDSINTSDPAQWPAGHALHPVENGLHWSWQGGYIFTALEGRSGTDGFSYHLGGAASRRTIELEVGFTGGGPVTLDVQIDIAAWLGDLNITAETNSTHSRDGDELAERLAARTPSAFRVARVHRDTFHVTARQAAAALPPGTTPYDLRITDRFPRPALPADNPLTNEGVALGRALFHDVRLSKVQTQSCASCHQASHGFTESLAISIGAEGQLGRRNSMPLTNLAWSRDLFWDGRAQTLREQVLMPITDKHEMNAPLDLVVERLTTDPAMQAAFAKAFGSPGITTDRIARALEQHLLTLLAQDSKFDHALRKMDKLTASEARGLQLFVTEFDPKRGLRGADCFHCHGGMLFTDYQHRNNGLRLITTDTGRMEITGQEADRGKFKTPSLRNIALTAPYMHDGRFKTLEEVMEHYSTGVHRSATLDPNLAKHPAEGIQLTTQDKADLIAFLKTLTDHSITSSDPALTQLTTPEAP